MSSQTRTHWKKLCNPDYLGSYALDPGEDLIVTIKLVKKEMVNGPDGKKEECIVAHFKENNTKPMVLNATNCKTIRKVLGTPFIEEWAGQQIQIFSTEVKAFGEMVDALRIRPQKPSKNLPELTPQHEKWAGAVNSIKEGRNDLAGVLKYFTMTESNAQRLLQEAENA